MTSQAYEGATTATGSPATPSPLLELSGISQRFVTSSGTTLALDGVDFQAPAGRFVSIVGPSGCGKSTLLMVMAGLHEPSAGVRTVNGAQVAGPQPDHIAVAFQDSALLPWRTAVENIAFPLELRGISKAERSDRAREMLVRIGLEGYERRYPRELSGGMRQRISVARALIQRPAVLLMDEPFGALDEQTRMDMGEQLLQLWDDIKCTVVFVTHNLTEAVYLSDEVVVMAAGPGRILETVHIDLDRPRDMEITGTEQFLHIRNRLWSLIKAQK
jgi:NitT/TauT family transport system ATP-binding protein